MQIDVITLFPEMIATIGNHGVVGRAIQDGTVRLGMINPRDFSELDHNRVDDRPYGGGPGMVMQYEPLQKAIKHARTQADAKGSSTVVYLSPQGKALDQATVRRFSACPQLVLLCGRYEGVDERLIETEIDEEWSLGDYVLSGGELAAMVVIDSVVRTLPGVLGDDQSAMEESFEQGLLDYPHYTRPEAIDGQTVPEVLLSGDHEKIARWRLKQALGRTYLRRPDLIEKRSLDEKEKKLLSEFLAEQVE